MVVHQSRRRLLWPSMMLVFTLTRPQMAVAQNTGTAAPPAPPARGFVGAGLLIGKSDAANRIRFPDDDRERLWLIEVGIPVSKLWSLGAEVTSLGTVTGGTRGVSFELNEKHHETLLQGLIRVRPVTGDRVALDLVGGAGVVFQKRDTNLCNHVQECAVRDDTSRRSPAFSAGVDVPVALTPHLGVSGILRVLTLRRGRTGDRKCAHPILDPSCRGRQRTDRLVTASYGRTNGGDVVNLNSRCTDQPVPPTPSAAAARSR